MFCYCCKGDMRMKFIFVFWEVVFNRNNVGYMLGWFELLKDGLEKVFVINYIG